MLLSLLGNIAKRGLPDRPYGLVYSDKETGFLPNLRAKTQYFRKNPVSGPLCDRPYEKTTRPIPDSICLKTLGQCDRVLLCIC